MTRTWDVQHDKKLLETSSEVYKTLMWGQADSHDYALQRVLAGCGHLRVFILGSWWSCWKVDDELVATSLPYCVARVAILLQTWMSTRNWKRIFHRPVEMAEIQQIQPHVTFEVRDYKTRPKNNSNAPWLQADYCDLQETNRVICSEFR